MKIENFISMRFIKEIRKNKEISAQSMIVIMVITISIIFFISAVSIMNGYIYGMMKLTFEIKSFHIDYPLSPSSSEAKRTLNVIRQDERVLYADSYREAKILISANGKNTGLVFFREVNENIFKNDKGFNKTLKLISGKKSLGLNEIMISEKTSRKLKVNSGDYIYLTAISTVEESRIILKRLKVSGIFTTGFLELDEQLGYVGTRTGERIFGSSLKYNIYIKLKDYKKAADFAVYYESEGFFGMVTWEENNYNDLTALNFEKNIIAFIVILVVFVAVLNLLTTIYITILEKNQDIGILKAVGYSPNNVVLVFLLNGIYIAVAGIFAGVTLGLLIMNHLNEILSFFGNLINYYNMFIYKISSLFFVVDKPEIIEIFSKDFYLDRIYTDISFSEIILISFLTLLFSILASIIPALKAGKIKPNEVIKNG